MRFDLRDTLVGIARGAVATIALSASALENGDVLQLKKEFEDAFTQYQRFSSEGDLPNAERVATLALELAEQIYGTDHANSAVLSFNLAKTLNGKFNNLQYTDIDFSEAYKLVDKEKEEKELMTKEEKKALA